jgi:hypothetical protein
MCVLERFTERSRQVIVLAQEEARQLHFSHIGTEALLLGLLREGNGFGASVLGSLGVTLERARAEIAQRVGSGAEWGQSAAIPFTPRATSVLERAHHESAQLGQSSTDPEHILLGLVDVDQGEGMNALRALGVNSTQIREAVDQAPTLTQRPADADTGTAGTPPAPPADRPTGRLRALEPSHIVSFSAFQRPAGPADSFVGQEPTASLGPDLNPELARRVYDGPEGTIDLVPGPNSINCVAIVTGTGETFAGGTSTTHAACDGVGYIRSAANRAAMFVGVLPAGARELHAIDHSGREIPVPLTADDAYWITIIEPIDMLWTNADGSAHQTAFGRNTMHRVILGD